MLYLSLEAGGGITCRPNPAATRLVSVRDGLSNVSFYDGSKFAYDNVCDLWILRWYNFSYVICTLFLLHFIFLVLIV